MKTLPGLLTVITIMQMKVNSMKDKTQIRRGQRQKNVTIDEKHVPIVDRDGNYFEMPSDLILSNQAQCLITAYGETYHTHVGCYKMWSYKYRSCFSGWQLVNKREAVANGMRKCRLCMAADKTEEKPLKVFTITSCVEEAIVTDYCIGNEIDARYDYNTGQTALLYEWKHIGNMPQTAVEIYNEYFDAIKLYIVQAYETNAGKVRIRIRMQLDDEKK